MSNILFINGNLHGHVHPTLPLVRELAARGENIWYFGADSFSHELEAAGAVPLKEGEELKEFYSTYRPAGSHPFFTILEYMIRLDEVLVSPDYRKNCQVLRQSFQETGGIKQAADYIEAFISAQKEAKENVPEK